MTKAPILSLRDAVLLLIKAVPEVSAACGTRVWDTIPTTGAVAKLPNVSCGPATRTREENGDEGLGRLRLRIFIASDQPTRDQAWSLAHAIEDALEGAAPEIGGGFHLIDILRVTGSGDVLDKIAPSEVFLDVATIAQRD